MWTHHAAPVTKPGPWKRSLHPCHPPLCDALIQLVPPPCRCSYPDGIGAHSMEQLFITLSAASIFDLGKIRWSLRPSVLFHHMVFLLCRCASRGASLTATLHRIREKPHTFAASAHVHIIGLSPHIHTHTHTHTYAHSHSICTFFIIIPELIGSNYLPWLWLVSL